MKSKLLLSFLVLLSIGVASAVQQGGGLTDDSGTLITIWNATNDGINGWTNPGTITEGIMVVDNELAQYKLYNRTSADVAVNVTTNVDVILGNAQTTDPIRLSSSDEQQNCLIRCADITCVLQEYNTSHSAGGTSFTPPDGFFNMSVSMQKVGSKLQCQSFINGVYNDTLNSLDYDDSKTGYFVSLYDNTAGGNYINITDIYAYLVSGLTTSISSPTNTTYATRMINLSYTADSDAPINYDCTVALDASDNDTYVVVDEAFNSFNFSDVTNGAHNITVNCFDGVTNSTDTVYFTVDTTLNLAVLSPLNQSYWQTGLTATYLANSSAATGGLINCTLSFDGVENDTYTDVNNTQRTFDFTETVPTEHYVTVNCYDGEDNETVTRYFTVDDINYTVTQNSSGYETSTHQFNLSVSFNPDIVDRVLSSFLFNHEWQDYDGIINTSLVTNRSWISMSLPVTTPNNTGVPTRWNITKYYVNGTTFIENTTNTDMNVQYVSSWDATSYSYNIMENDTQDIRINITKKDNLDLVTLAVSLNYNGSPYSMTQELNKTSYYTFKYNGTAPLLNNAEYNITDGFNITINTSATTTSGWNSRLDSNSSYNFTQTLYIPRLINCSTGGVATMDLQLWNAKNTTEKVTGQIELNITIINYTSRNYNFLLQDQSNYTLCLMPYWGYFRAYAEMDYEPTGYKVRTHFLTNSTLYNTTKNVLLYNLNTTYGTITNFNVIDATGESVEDVIIIARRQYLDAGVYRSVAMGKTDDNGECAMYLEWNSAKYDFQVVNSSTGVLLKHTVTTLITTANTPITINIESGSVFSYWEKEGYVVYNVTNTTVGESVNFTVNALDTSGSATSISLECLEFGMLNTTIIYSESVSATSASLTCVLGNITQRVINVKTSIYFPDDSVISFTEYIDARTPYNMSFDGVFASFMVIGVSAFSGMFNPAAMIITAIIGLIFMYALGFSNLALSTVIGLVCSNAVIAYLVRRKR